MGLEDLTGSTCCHREGSMCTDVPPRQLVGRLRKPSFLWPDTPSILDLTYAGGSPHNSTEQQPSRAEWKSKLWGTFHSRGSNSSSFRDPVGIETRSQKIVRFFCLSRSKPVYYSSHLGSGGQLHRSIYALKWSLLSTYRIKLICLCSRTFNQSGNWIGEGGTHLEAMHSDAGVLHKEMFCQMQAGRIKQQSILVHEDFPLFCDLRFGVIMETTQENFGLPKTYVRVDLIRGQAGSAADTQVFQSLLFRFLKGFLESLVWIMPWMNVMKLMNPRIDD